MLIADSRLYDRRDRHLCLDRERHVRQLRSTDHGRHVVLRSGLALRPCRHIHVLHRIYRLRRVSAREHMSTPLRKADRFLRRGLLHG